MAEELQLNIITPTREVLRTGAEWVVVPGAVGSLGVLPEHRPLVTTLDTGILEYRSGERTTKVAVHYGYAQVQGDTVNVLAEMAERAEELDLHRARDAERRAREQLAELQRKQDDEMQRMDKFEAKLKRAMVRQQLGA